MKYRLKNAETEAVQWDGSEEALEAIRAMITDHEPMDNNHYVEINDIRFYAGQWIFPDLSRMNDDEFHGIYEPVTEPETCVWKNTTNYWFTGCGDTSASIGKPSHCPKCGRKIEERVQRKYCQMHP